MRHLVLVVITVVVVAATCSIAVPVNGAVANSTSPVGVEPAAAGAAAAEAPPELVNDDQPSDDDIDASALPDGVAPGSKDSSNTTTGVDWEQAEASLTAYTRNLTSDTSSGSSNSNSSTSSTASGDEEGAQQPLLAPSEVKQWDGALSNLGVDDDGEDDDAEGGGDRDDAAGTDSGSGSGSSGSRSSSNTEEADSEPADADGSDSDSGGRGQDLTPTEPQATNTTDKEGSQPGDDDDVATESRLAKLQAHLKGTAQPPPPPQPTSAITSTSSFVHRGCRGRRQRTACRKHLYTAEPSCWGR